MVKDEKMKVLIEDVITKNPEVAEPIIVNFSNGSLATQDIECALFKNTSTKAFRRQRQRIMCAKTNHLTYAGKNFGEVNSSYVKEQKFLGVLDKKTNKMKLIECSSFLLHPITDDVNIVKDGEKASKSKVIPNSIVEFGGKYAKRKHEKKISRKIDMDVMVTPLTKALKENVTPLEEVIKFNEFEDILPPCDRLATDASKVYNMESIVSDDVLLLLYEQVTEHKDEIEKAKWISPQMKMNTASIKFITDEDESNRLTCASLYTEYLMQLVTLNQFSLNKSKYILSDCPNFVEDEIHSKYTIGKFPKRSQSMKSKDMLVCHILVLCLLINGLQFHLETMLRALKYQKDRLLNLCRCIGVTHDTVSGYLILKLPLAKPLITRKDRKRKRK